MDDQYKVVAGVVVRPEKRPHGAPMARFGSREEPEKVARYSPQVGALDVRVALKLDHQNVLCKTPDVQQSDPATRRTSQPKAEAAKHACR